jgi:hypothetical protein
MAFSPNFFFFGAFVYRKKKNERLDMNIHSFAFLCLACAIPVGLRTLAQVNCSCSFAKKIYVRLIVKGIFVLR